MISPLAERYRAERRSVVYLGLGGLALVVVGALFAWPDPWPLWPALVFGAAAILSGLTCWVVAFRQARWEFIAAPEGVRFGEAAPLIPWRDVGGLRPGRFDGSFDVLADSGARLGTVSGASADLGRVFLLLLRATTGRVRSSGIDTRGGHGWRPLFYPLLGLGVVILKVGVFEPVKGRPHWGWFVALLLVGVGLENWIHLRRVGGARLVIDAEGIRFRRRKEKWSVRWDAIVRIIPLVHGPKPGALDVLLIEVKRGEGKALPLVGFDLLAIVSAVGTFSPELMQRSFLPSEPLPSWFDRAISNGGSEPRKVPSR